MNQSQALQLLELNEGASPQEVKAAYRRKAMLHHPDKGGRKEDFILIKQAYDYLVNGGENQKSRVSVNRGGWVTVVNVSFYNCSYSTGTTTNDTRGW